MELTVDGHPIEVPEGAHVLDATRTAGTDVPTLCHDDRVSPAGVCRACLVRADGEVVAACVTPAVAGMVVTTTDSEVTSQVSLVLGLMAERLPVRALDRPSELTALCERFGVGSEAFGGGRGLDRDESHPYFTLDRDLCISCGRCVRMCDEVQGSFALTLAGRGADTVVAPGHGGAWIDSACVSCGGCVDSCPTRALAERSDGVPATTTTRTTCGYCGVGCALDVHSAGDRVVSVTPAHDGPVNRGHACVKGRFAHGSVRSPQRLTTPLIRRDGELRPASWDDALAYVGAELGRIRSAHGPDAIAAISSARATNEENYLMQKLMRTVVGTNNVDNCSRICHAPSAAGLTAAFGLSGGTNPADDIERADVFLLAGTNATEAHPVVGARIKQQGCAEPVWSSWTRAALSSPDWPTCTCRHGRAPTSRSSTGWPGCYRGGLGGPRLPGHARRRARPAPGGRGRLLPRVRRAGLRRTGGAAARCGAPVRHGRGAHDRLWTRGDRACARHRRRPHPGEPGHPPWCGGHRARRRCRSRCAARTTSRGPRTWVRCPTCSRATSG